MIEILKNIFLYDTLPLLLCAVLIGWFALTRGPSSARWGRRLVLAAAACAWLASTKPGAALMVELIAWNLGPATIEDVSGVGAVVVLDGGTKRIIADGREVMMVSDRTALRAIEAVRVANLIGSPLVIVSGGAYGPEATSLAESEALRDAIVRLGISGSRVVVDFGSRNTREHAINLRSILETRHITRFVLVTSPTNIRRALSSLRALGLSPIPSAARAWPEDQRPIHLDYWWPSRAWLSVSEAAMYELVGLPYYLIRGWLS